MPKIEIYGPQSMLRDCPASAIPAVDKVTSYLVEGYFWSKAFKRGQWDGRKRLFRKRTGAFPTGLVPAVQEALQGLGEVVEVVDHREIPKPLEAGYGLLGVSFDYPYDYQLDACQKMIEKKQGILRMATNSGKTECACAVTQYLGLPTLFLVTSLELMYQAQNRFMERLGKSKKEIGIVGDGHWEPGSWVTIASVGTLDARKNTTECMKLLKQVDVLFLDECHNAPAEGYYTAATLCKAYYRFGMSGTPLSRGDGANLKLIAATGDVIVDISNKFLVDRGVSAKGHIIFDKITEPLLKKGIRYPTAYKQGVVENPQMLKKVVEWTKIFHKLGLGTLILVEEIQHGRLIDDALWTDTGGDFISHQFIYGEESSEVRKKALADFSDRTLPVLLASVILDEGIDVPTIDALIVAGSRKSKIRTMQRLGRGLRGEKLIVVEFANFTNKYLSEHSLKRLADYKSEKCFPIYNSGPDEVLVSKIWER